MKKAIHRRRKGAGYGFFMGIILGDAKRKGEDGIWYAYVYRAKIERKGESLRAALAVFLYSFVYLP